MKDHDELVGISTAICTHIPDRPFSHVGQVINCKLCGKLLVYGNNPAGTRQRMSKKVRRGLKARIKNHE